jgi:light-regulated signal transduction histidine kinase (bacteriophytochrome)
MGIAPEHRERLFEEFFQVGNSERNRTKGFGLGLAIARRMARQMGGDVTLESAGGRGSRFTVVLPLGIPLSDISKTGHAGTDPFGTKPDVVTNSRGAAPAAANV